MSGVVKISYVWIEDEISDVRSGKIVSGTVRSEQHQT